MIEIPDDILAKPQVLSSRAHMALRLQRYLSGHFARMCAGLRPRVWPETYEEFQVLVAFSKARPS